MKEFSTIILALLLMAIFSLPVPILAATNPGVKPGSFFYFFDTTFEKVGLFFTFNPEKKARKALDYADERLAEIEAIADKKNPNAVKTAIADYKNNVILATEKSKEVKDKGQAENLLASIEDNASKNQEVLSAVLIKVPEEAREAITQAIEASRRGQEEAAKQIAELKGEVEKLKEEVVELKVKNAEREKVIEELSKRKPETSTAQTKSSIPQTTGIIQTTKPVTFPPQTPPKTNETQNSQPTTLTPRNTTYVAIQIANKAIKEPSVSAPPLISSKKIPVKVLKIYADKSEMWASGFHYVNFSFEYLVDNQPIKASVSLKNIIPLEPITAGWQALISTDKNFSYSTKVSGKHTLKFITDTSVEGEATITAREWLDKKELEIVPIKTSNSIEVTNNGYFAYSPSVFLGSFKIRTNPDINISLYDCNFSVTDSDVTFGFYKITGALDGEKNNCFTNTGYILTDGNGLSEKEFRVYINDLKISYVNNPGPVYRIRFYLNDITIRENTTGTYRHATSSLVFDLEATRYK